MTIAEYTKKHGAHRLEAHPTGECITVIGIDEDANGRYRDLWSLSDYYVSSVSGGSVWLCPRPDYLHTRGTDRLLRDIAAR